VGPSLVPARRGGCGNLFVHPSIWFTMTADGTTTMHMSKAEMPAHRHRLRADHRGRTEVPGKVKIDIAAGERGDFAIYGLGLPVNSGSVTTEFDRSRAPGRSGASAHRSGCKLLKQLTDCHVSRAA